MADVTAIVLNWARLENVKTIVAHLCSESLRDTISGVIVWNNSPDKVEASEFFTDERVKIVNAEENLFFQARFLACLEADGEWCLVQDDDYLVSSESIKALRKYVALYDAKYPIHLLPPHEHLSTTLRILTHSSSHIASFAWLGHGTILSKSHARAFIELLKTESGGQEHIMQMADNFFSVLSNRRADIWVDRGMHFVEGREVAFTVGAEGDARNWYYTAIAEKYLEGIVRRTEPNGYTDLEPKEEEELITRSPGVDGLWSTNVPMLPQNVFEAGRNATDLRSADMTRRSALGEVDAKYYIQHSFACLGDGLPHTVFKSPAGCQEGQWLSFDFLEKVETPRLEVEWVVEPEFAEEAQGMVYQVLEDQTWINAVVKESTHDESESPNPVKLVTKLDLESPRTFKIVRAIIGPGSGSERPAWGVAGCVVRAAPE
ncbi:hypothetical protein RSOLAG1IB_01625 [Rhizoctonia solani AG-1 IB]|uniref:Uncharacterized protein n=1 Tax=Thanatephorus cucumeris (strain AG1-IB / isolate 7/3/14) TaxID=1108050 RepID=A0A0B7FHE8_THACB|nr:hypothetical protein RSOLAG1IB_01625 [Rhizoctonia solani AG-1 IB]